MFIIVVPSGQDIKWWTRRYQRGYFKHSNWQNLGSVWRIRWFKARNKRKPSLIQQAVKYCDTFWTANQQICSSIQDKDWTYCRMWEKGIRRWRYGRWNYSKSATKEKVFFSDSWIQARTWLQIYVWQNWRQGMCASMVKWTFKTTIILIKLKLCLLVMQFNSLVNRIKSHTSAFLASGQYEEPVDPSVASQVK